MRPAYSSRSFSSPSSRKGAPWKWILIFFVVGIVIGVVFDQYINVHKPIELVISTPQQDFSQVKAKDEDVWSANGNLSVKIPKKDSIVFSPFKIEGQVREVGSNVVARLRNARDEEVAKVSATTNPLETGIYGDYSVEISFSDNGTDAGQIEVFQESKDGSEIDKIIIPVRFK